LCPRASQNFSRGHEKRAHPTNNLTTVFLYFLKEGNMKVYYDKDADLSLIKGKKVTIVGYGSQATHMRRT
jgi:hypothetical protein